MNLKNLFQSKYKHPKPEVRKKAVKKIKDEVLLKQIVKEDRDCKVKLAALDQIQDLSIIFDIARYYRNDTVTKEAVNRLEDTKDIISLVDNAASLGARIASIRRVPHLQIDDKEKFTIIYKTALKAWQNNLRGEAINLLQDPAALKEIAQNDVLIFNRIKAAEKLQNNELLADILNNETKNPYKKLNISACLKIIDLITDEAILTNVSKNNPIFELRQSAEEKVKSEVYHQEIIESKTKRYANYTWQDVVKLDDLEKEFDVALYGTKSDIRIKAIECIYSRYGTGKITGRKAFMPQKVKYRLAKAIKDDHDSVIRDYLSCTLGEYPSAAK